MARPLSRSRVMVTREPVIWVPEATASVTEVARIVVEFR
jgi:hypothetical protein